jgi:hypothetical protein
MARSQSQQGTSSQSDRPPVQSRNQGESDDTRKQHLFDQLEATIKELQSVSR